MYFLTGYNYLLTSTRSYISQQIGGYFLFSSEVSSGSVRANKLKTNLHSY